MIQIPRELEGEYIIRVMDMPECLNGMVKYDENDFANIYINVHLSPEGRRKAADHELTHVINDDIHNTDDIRTIEARADGHATPLHRLPPLFKASDLLESRSKSLPPEADSRTHRFPHRARDGEVGRPKVGSDEVPRSQPPIYPRQAAVLLRAISDLDDWLFRDTAYDL